MDRSLFEDDLPQIPDQWNSSIDFDETITSFSLSFHGYMMCVGFINGKLIVCDSETGSNQYTFTTDGNAIKSVSFSRDGKLIASGDSMGIFQVLNFLDNNIIFKKPYQTPILKVSFSPRSLAEVLILTEDHSLYLLNIETNEEHLFEENTVSACWCPTYEEEDHHVRILLTNGETVSFYDENLELISERKFTERKRPNITSIEVSHNGFYLLVLTREKVNIYTVGFGSEYIGEINESVAKFSMMAFEGKDKFVYFASESPGKCSLFIYNISGGSNEIVNNLNGPPETVTGLIAHPVHPVLYSADTSSIRIWTPTYMNRWSKFTPGFVDVLANIYYDEKENEFDEEETVEEVPKIEITEPIEVINPTHNYSMIFPSDEEWPDQMIYLPLKIQQPNLDQTRQNVFI